IVYLSERFLRQARGLRVVKSPNEACLLTLCRPLVDRWLASQLPYGPGQVTLIFHDDAVSGAADILMYVPVQGDRFLYTKPHLDASGTVVTEAAATLSTLAEGLARLGAQQQMIQETVSSALSTPAKAAGVPADSEALMRGISQAFQSSSRPMLSALAQLTNRIQQLEAAVNAKQSPQPSRQASPSTPPNGDGSSKVDPRLETLIRQLYDRQKFLQTKLEQISAQMTTLSESLGESSPPVPQTDEEWRSRIERTWGTVGDYETYSAAYREMHAETPLFETPDWVMLCEFDWAQRLCPTLAELHALLYGPDGIGDEGADILQQFGAHCRDGGQYYLYQERGYSAETALQEIAHHPDYSWLPTLRQLWQTLKIPNHKIFQLFGWEPTAVAALRDIADPPRRHSSASSGSSNGRTNPDGTGSAGYGYGQSKQRQSKPSGTVKRSLLDYQTMLNIGPFAPLTAEAVKRAYRQAMKRAHPDSGGSTQQAQEVNEAYRAVMRHYFPEKS
ncbi:MAG: hypothetical protein ACFB4J_19815, partial [Elainellaceae cyanobacterium]